jgi:hypothetical protein
MEPRLERPFPPRDALYHDYVGVYSWAAAGYNTGAYGGKLTCYWPREEPSVARTWQPIISRKRRGDVEEHHVGGSHMSCVTDHVEELARALGDCLDTLERRAHSAS